MSHFYSTRDEEKQKRASKRLAEKMRSAEEKVRAEAERHSRCSEKHERKTAERLERAKKRCEQIRQIIGAFDPANLSIDSENSCNGTSACSNASAIPPAVNPAIDVLHPTPEIIRLVSNTILAGCLQPANLINKILSDIMGMVPPAPAENEAQASGQASNDQQQQTEVPKQHTATNTSDLNTPTASNDLSNEEIKALFKEAAKELEKMNEIANSSKTMESSTMSGGSSNSVITQIERVIKTPSESSVFNSTVVLEPVNLQNDVVDARAKSPDIEESFKIVSPPKSIMRSRESSIEVHDVNSMMSDDSRDWTMLDATTNENDEEVSFISASIYPSIPVNEPEAASDNEKYNESLKSVSTETQTPSVLSSVTSSAIPTPEEVRATIQKSIESVGELSEMVRNSIASAQQSLSSFQQPEVTVPKPVKADEPPPKVVTPEVTPSAQMIDSERKATSVASQATPNGTSVASQITESVSFIPTAPSASVSRPIWPPIPPRRTSPVSQANLMATTSGTKPKAGPAVIVYDPNPKVNTAVHTMMAMGFSNDGE